MFISMNAGKITWELPPNSSQLALKLAELSQQTNAPIIVIGADRRTLDRIAQACRFFAPEIPLLPFPDWETLPYDQFSPHPDIIAERIETLSKLSTLRKGILLVPASTLAQRLCPTEFVHAHTFILRKGDTLLINQLRDKLEYCGYHHVTQVLEPGEYAIRGSVFDLFPMGHHFPIRIDLFDNEIDSIRTFDPETQRSEQSEESIEILPAKEFPFDETAITLFRQQWRIEFAEKDYNASLYKEISSRHLPPGIEYYLPLFFKETATLFDYFSKDSQLLFYGDMHQSLEGFWKELQERYHQLAHDREKPILPPNKLYLAVNEVYQNSKAFTQIQVQLQPESKPFPSLEINHKLAQPLSAIAEFLSQHKNDHILFCCETTGRREALLGLLKNIHCVPKVFNSWNEFLSSPATVGICIADIETGVFIPERSIILIAENQLYPEKIKQQRYKRKGSFDAGENAIRNLAELKPDDLVVHLNHGVGRYKGLHVLTIDNQPAEFLLLEYANQDKLYVPITSLQLISRYSGVDSEHAALQRLGNSNWQKVKRQASEQLRDVAAELLELYAKRAAKEGFAFAEPDENYQRFAAEFPFEETPDQETVIQQVIEDMTRKQPMDRLVCGDVGFGKTEVAMRAAFLAVQNNKQVVVLVPTTLLAQQHFNTFSDRFSEWPVTIEMISRFRTAKEQKDIVTKLGEGKIDIVIGTHKLLNENIKFANLGLVIVDEEHRFGVKQKDQMKKLRAEVDILTLTATPIPRTLNMALSSIRDLSIISTPPQRRLAIKTFVRERNPTLIREAILREISRGGQVFYLHNDVATIANTANEIGKLVPEAKVDIAHGQMREKQLEHIMAQFYHQKFNVLVCTTIIETGIDIPSANTIIMDRADKFGLAQLHQLRGRVGRSHHQAYAFLFSPPLKLLSGDAIKRLEAIETLEDLGAGFALASQDLEIRGAGELLGEEQSGNIQALGFTLYMELLEETVKALKSGKIPEQDLLAARSHNTEIELHIPALIPENYLPDIQLRLVFYKRIANATTEEQITDLKVEMIDRFGLLATPINNLFKITEFKLQAETLGIRKFELYDNGGKITFINKPPIDPIKIIKLIQEHPKQLKLSSNNTVTITRKFLNAEEKFSFIEFILGYFINNN